MASIGINLPEKYGIPEFYAGKSVFLTGFTGFLGSAIAEKLLRGCPGIKKIYVLIRSKKDLDAQRRLDNLLKSPLFNKMRDLVHSNEIIDPFSKLVPILGDMALPCLGLGPEDVALLADQVSIVFHSAATVKFDEPLKLAMKVNVEGTKNVLDLARGMKNLRAFVYVSTAYSNCERVEIEEVVYPIHIDPLAAIQVVTQMSDEEANSIKPKVIGNKPNTYTFTKHLAEILVLQSHEKDGIPACIVRPSIVAATEKSPFPGWVDNLNGASGPLAALSTGMLTSLLCCGTFKSDLIPLDHAVDVVITSAWTTAVQTNANAQMILKSSKKDAVSVPVFNCCSSADNPTTWNEFLIHCSSAIWHNPIAKTVRYPNLQCYTTSPFLDQIRQFLFHRVPATLVDFLVRLFGGTPMFLRMHIKIRQGIKPLYFFTTREWDFSTRNTRWLLSQLNERDRQVFDFDIKKLNWKEYDWNYVVGLGKYVFKQSEEDTKKARRKLKILYLCHRLVQLAGILGLIFCLKYSSNFWLKLVSASTIKFKAVFSSVLLILTLLKFMITPTPKKNSISTVLMKKQ